MAIQLGQVQETLLIPLYMRAKETNRPDAIITDPRAVDIVDSLDYDFRPFDAAWKVQLDVAIRTQIFDNIVREFVAANSNVIVVNLGAGLDGRFERFDNGQLRWFDLDLPDSIALRRQFYEESPRHVFLSQSAFDTSWLDHLKRDSNESVLILAEGLFCYFEEQDVRQLFITIADRLPGAEIAYQSISPRFVNQQHKVPAINSTQAVFRWGVETGRELEAWDPRIEFLEEWAFIDFHRPRWRYLRWATLLPPVYKILRDVMKITHMRFAA
jgi:O-methyltransferase involved in polyketide biosynthesis